MEWCAVIHFWIYFGVETIGNMEGSGLSIRGEGVKVDTKLVGMSNGNTRVALK